MHLIKTLNSVVFNPLVWLLLGLCFAFIGISLIADIPKLSSQLRLMEQLPVFAVAKPGERAFLEGQISAQNPPVYNQFVAYVREEYRSSIGRNLRWVEVARQTPPLIIEVQGKAVRVVNEDYAFKTADVTLEEASPTVTRGAVQARGFVTGSLVFAIGSKQDEGFVAEFFYAGTRSDYVAYLSHSLRGRMWFGGGILFIALCFIFWGGFIFWRGRQLHLVTGKSG